MAEDKKNRIKRAALLKYKPGEDREPIYLGTGSGPLAAQIIELAKKHNVEIVENPELCRTLSTLPVNSPIPENLYLAIAEVIAFCYRMKTKKNSEK